MLFFADDLVERVDHFLDVMHVEVVGAALIARLRPATLRGAAGLFADDLFFTFGAGAEDEDARLVGVEHHGGIARIVFDQLGQRIQMRHRADEQPVSPIGASSGMASNRSDPVHAKIASACPAAVVLSRYSWMRSRPSRSFRARATRSGSAFRALVEDLADELLVVLAAVLIGREAEVQADYGERTGLQRGQSFHSLTQRLHGYGCRLGHTATTARAVPRREDGCPARPARNSTSSSRRGRSQARAYGISLNIGSPAARMISSSPRRSWNSLLSRSITIVFG